MTKHKVNILIALMAVALLGIILLQLVWMKNAMQVRNELFDRSVQDALIATSKRMETMDDVFMVHDIVNPIINPRRFKMRQINQTQINRHNVIVPVDSLEYESDIIIPDIKKYENTIKIITSEKGDSLNSDVIIEIIKMDSVINNWEEKIEHNITLMYDQSVDKMHNDSDHRIERREFEQRVGRKKERLKNVAGRMFYETWTMDRTHLPDTAIIQKVLKDELLNRDIPISYEMGVFYATDKMVKSANADSLLIVNANYSANLFPGNIFDRNEKLSIYFPGRKAFILKTLIGPGLLSLLFCAFIMIVFGLSIFYILNQKKISEMKSDFINNMTHEFKTPLATISVASDTILNQKIIDDRVKVKHFIEVIKKENLRMNQQVETILQIARLDQKDFEFSFKVYDIHELIDKAVLGILLQVENKNGKIKVLKEAVNPVVTTDEIHTLNLLNNLFDNANKYSPEEPQIEVRTRNAERGVWITVSDKGIGMNKQVQQKIFEKFYRETSGNIHNVKGFGLGLSYVKAVVDANKGEVKVKSEPGKGSTFEVFIPFTLANNK